MMYFLVNAFLLNGWTKQLQTLQMLWLAQKRVFAMVYHRLKSSYNYIHIQNFGANRQVH